MLRRREGSITLGPSTQEYAESAADSAISLGSIIGDILVVATSNITLSDEQTIDGQTTLSSRVLLTGKTDTSDNGVWTTAADIHAQGLLCTALVLVSEISQPPAQL